MAGEINFNLLDPNGPAKVGNAFFQGQQDQTQLEQNQVKNKLYQLSLDQNQQAMADDKATRSIYQQYKDDPAARLSALASISPEAYQNEAQFQSKQQASQQTIDKNTFDMHVSRLDWAKKNLAEMIDDPNLSHAAVIGRLSSGLQSGILDQDSANQILQNLPETDDPKVLRGHLLKGLAATLDAKQQFEAFAPNVKFEDTGGEMQGIDTNPNSPTYLKPVTTLKKSVSPDKTALLKAQEGEAANFGDDAVEAAAARYNLDGTLPSLGMGKAASATRAKILNRAAAQAKEAGVSPVDQRVGQIGGKASSASLANLQKQQDAVGAFEKTFNSNADLALGLSAKVDRTGSPLVNRWINSGKRAVAGDADLAAFDQAIKSTVNEYAKIVSGSMGNTAMAESEIRKVEDLLNTAQNDQQVIRVIRLMKQETQNRMKGFDDQKAEIRNSMSGKKASPGGNRPALDSFFGS